MKLKKTLYSINIDSSAPGCGGLAGKCLAVLTDFHDRAPGPVLDMLRNDIPDAIMIPGDFVLGYFPEGEEYVLDRCRNAITLLEGCCGIAPTYMSLGNHECMLCDGDYDRLRATGAILLDNEWTEAAEGILVGGFTSAYAISFKRFRDEYNRRNGTEEVKYPYRRRPRDISKHPTDRAWLDDFEQADGYKILLCHHPEYWSLREPMIKDRKIDLVLSGHAHGGQWRFMGRGVFAPGQGLFPKYTGGIHQGQYGSLIVSRGLSNPYKIVPRLGNPPEVVYLQFE
ncbi:MAG: metallophosphoesterase [Mogibacterium sp.]|nr:metallophosphoesterase [Mogibacterium sp.]